MISHRLRHLLLPPASPETRPPGEDGSGWLLFWLLWSLLISAIYWILGPHSYLRIQDNADFNVPYRIAAARDLLQYGFTFWQPKFSGGMPAMVHPQIDSFVIDALPYLLFPAWVVYGLVMWAQRFLAGYFTFRLCRGILGLDATASLFAGMAFSLYLWNVQDMKLVEALGLPAVALLFLLFDRLPALPPGRALPLAALMGAITALTAQSVLYTAFLIPALPFWFLIVRRTPWSLLWPGWLAFATGAVALEAPQFVALFAYSPVTTRGQAGAATLEPVPGLAELLRGVWESLGWGLLPQNGLFLALFVLGVAAARFRPAPLAWRLGGLYLLCGVGPELGHWLQCLWQNLIPPSRGNMRDFNQFAIFLGPLVGAVGLHLIRNSLSATTRPATRRLVLLVTLVALAAPLIGWQKVTRQLLNRLSTDNYAIQFDNPVIKALAARKRSGEPFRVAAAGTWPPTIASASGGRIYPAFPHAYDLETADGYYRLHSARYHRFWRRVIAKALTRYPEQEERTLKWYYLFRRPEERFAVRQPMVMNDWYNLDLLSLANTRYLLSHWPLEHPDLVNLHDPAPELARGRAWDNARLREKILATAIGDLPHHALYLYENRAALPRVFLPTRARLFPDGDSLLEALAATPASELRATAFLENADFPLPPPLSSGSATIESYTPDRIALNVTSDGPALLVVTNTFDPYWRVTINGAPGQPLPAYHAFQGIRLPAGGRSRVELDYRPPYRGKRGTE